MDRLVVVFVKVGDLVAVGRGLPAPPTATVGKPKVGYEVCRELLVCGEAAYAFVLVGLPNLLGKIRAGMAASKDISYSVR